MAEVATATRQQQKEMLMTVGCNLFCQPDMARSSIFKRLKVLYFISGSGDLQKECGAVLKMNIKKMPRISIRHLIVSANRYII